MIAKIFDAHPDVSAPGAAHLFKVMSECANRYAVSSDELRGAVLDLFDAKVSHWAIDEWTLTRRAALLTDLTHAGEMAAALYAAEARSGGKAHVFTKENSSFRYLPMLLTQSTRPRFLFMTRDPRDMAVSWVNGPVMRGGVLRAAERWNQDQTGYLQAKSELPAQTPVGMLRYEDLIVEPEAELRRVCDELELEFDPEMLRFSEKSRSAQSDAKRSAMWSNLDKPLLSGNSNKFLDELSDDAIAYIEAVNGPLMEVFGYESVRADKPPFGRFETLDALRADLALQEPYDKPAYQELPPEERARFENWSRLYATMRARPVHDPDVLLSQKR
ncbi:sulfotransferase [Aliiroseovarius sp. S1339]|nr:sulfotransferase [Aliiroseovarius sp. S1339]